MPLYRKIGGAYCFTVVRPSICLSVCASICLSVSLHKLNHENSTFSHYSSTNLLIRLIFGMKAYLINMHLLVPRSRSSAQVKVKCKGYISQKMAFSGGIPVSQTHLVLFYCLSDNNTQIISFIL